MTKIFNIKNMSWPMSALLTTAFLCTIFFVAPLPTTQATTSSAVRVIQLDPLLSPSDYCQIEAKMGQTICARSIKITPYTGSDSHGSYCSTIIHDDWYNAVASTWSPGIPVKFYQYNSEFCTGTPITHVDSKGHITDHWEISLPKAGVPEDDGLIRCRVNLNVAPDGSLSGC